MEKMFEPILDESDLQLRRSMRHLVAVEMYDVDGVIERIEGMSVCTSLEKAQELKQFLERYYDDHGYAVCVIIRSEVDVLKALGRISDENPYFRD